MFQRWIVFRFRHVLPLIALGCASAPPAALLENAQRVAIRSQGKSSVADLRAHGRLESALRGAGSATVEAFGACGGSSGGGDFAAFGLMLCLGLATIVGGMGGGILGATEGLPRDQVRDLNRDLEGFVRGTNLEDGFTAVLSDQIRSQRSVSDVDPDLVLLVRLRQAHLRQHSGSQLSLALAASVELQFPRSSVAGSTYTRTYQYEGARHHVDAWLAESGAGVAREVDGAFTGLAKKIVYDLWNSTAWKSPPNKVLQLTWHSAFEIGVW